MPDNINYFSYIFFHNYRVQYASIFITSIASLTAFTVLLMKATENYMRRDRVYPEENKKSKTMKVLTALLLTCIFVTAVISMSMLAWYFNRSRLYTDPDLLVSAFPDHWRAARTLLAMDVALVLLSTLGFCFLCSKKFWLDPGSVLALAVMFAVIGTIRLIANIVYLAQDGVYNNSVDNGINGVSNDDQYEYFNSYHHTRRMEWASLFIQSVLGFILFSILMSKFV